MEMPHLCKHTPSFPPRTEVGAWYAFARALFLLGEGKRVRVSGCIRHRGDLAVLEQTGRVVDAAYLCVRVHGDVMRRVDFFFACVCTCGETRRLLRLCVRVHHFDEKKLTDTVLFQ